MLAADLGDDRTPRSSEMTEVVNYVRTAEQAYAAVADGYPISVTLMCQLHATLVEGTSADGDQRGRIRTCQVAIGGRSIENARFVPAHVVDLLIGSPIVTVPQLVERIGATLPTVNTAVGKLVSLGILTEVGGNPRKFYALDVIRATG